MSRAAAVLLAAAAVVLALDPGRSTARTCGFGEPIEERVVLRPAPGTFFAVDALNPDVVRTGGRYLLFFSGNAVHAAGGGDWRTGLATARDPLGPFTLRPRVREPFLNGGTLMRDGRLLHAASVAGQREPGLFGSATGTSWSSIGEMPAPRRPSWRFHQSDLYLYRKGPGVAAYYAARPGAGGANIGSARYRAGHWSRFRLALGKQPGWDQLDLGEPAVFRARGRTYMLYGGLGGHGEPRHIGLARLTRTGWRRCGRKPFISAGRDWYVRNAIDPEPQIVGDNLFVYFGGGVFPSLGGDMRGTIGLRVYRLPERR